MSDATTALAAAEAAAASSTTASEAADFAAEKAVEVNTAKVAAQTAKTDAETARDDAESFALGFDGGTATALAPGAAPTVEVVGPAGSRVINLGIPAGLADDASMDAVRANPASAFAQGLSATQAAAMVVHTRGSDLLPVEDAAETESPSAVFLCTIDGDLYGFDRTTSSTLKRSTNDGASWTTIHDFTGAGQIVTIQPLGNGEVFVLTPGAGYRSTGWATNPLTATWASVVTPSQDDLGQPRANFINAVYDVHDNFVLLGEYISPRNNSRRVRLSTDYGATFTSLFDLNTYYPGQEANTHIHGVAIDWFHDPVTPRLWFTHGDGPRGVFYSDDLGGTWTMLPGTDATGNQFMTIRATEHGMVLTTDSNAPDGIYRILRTDDPADMVLECIYRIPYRFASGSLLGFGSYTWRDPDTGLVYMGWTVNTPSGATEAIPAWIFVSDGLRANRIWSGLNNSTTAAQASVIGLGITSSGLFVASYHYGVGTTKVNVTATLGGRGGTPFNTLNGGNVLTGRATTREAVAAGPYATAHTQSVAIGSGAADASAGSTYRGIAIGASSVGGQDGVAIGYTATVAAAAVGSVAIGSGASVASPDTVAIGKSVTAPQNAVVVGASASVGGAGTGQVVIGKSASVTSGSTSVAIGNSATVGSTDAVAIGRAASAGWARSVALGSATTASADDQVQINTRHFELAEIAADPSAPAVNKGRLYLKDNGSGKTGLYIRFNTGAVQQIALEP